MKVKEIMSKPAAVCRADDTLHTAAQLMWQHDCGVLPVVKDDGSVVGMITDRDVCMSAYTQGAPLQAIRVSSAMAGEVASCRADESLDAAERLMRERKVRRIPVLDAAGRPLGVLSLNDLARHAASVRGNGFDKEVTRTLAAVCEPWTAPPPARKPRLRAKAREPRNLPM
jgi:CBS domain-containing protein